MNKSSATPTKKTRKGIKKDYGKYGSEKFDQGKLAKQLYAHKHE